MSKVQSSSVAGTSDVEASTQIPSTSSPFHSSQPGSGFQYPFNSLQTPRRDLPKVPIPITSPAPFEEEDLPFTLPRGPYSTSKPPYSYAALIGQAILASHKRKLSLNQIYTYISTVYPYYEFDQPGWRNSIRHNLSLNGAFCKVPRDSTTRGKGSLWAIVPGELECFKGGGYQRKGALQPITSKKRKHSEEVERDEEEESEADDEIDRDGRSSSFPDPIGYAAPSQGNVKRKKGSHTTKQAPMGFPSYPSGMVPPGDAASFGGAPIVYYPVPFVQMMGPNGVPQFYPATMAYGGNLPAGMVMPAMPGFQGMAGLPTMPMIPMTVPTTSIPFYSQSSNPYSYLNLPAALKKTKTSTYSEKTLMSSSSITSSMTTLPYSTPARPTSVDSTSDESPLPLSSPLPASSPLSQSSNLMSSPLPPSSPPLLPSSSPAKTPSDYTFEEEESALESGVDAFVLEKTSTRRKRRSPSVQPPIGPTIADLRTPSPPRESSKCSSTEHNELDEKARRASLSIPKLPRRPSKTPVLAHTTPKAIKSALGSLTRTSFPTSKARGGGPSTSTLQRTVQAMVGSEMRSSPLIALQLGTFSGSSGPPSAGSLSAFGHPRRPFIESRAAVHRGTRDGSPPPRSSSSRATVRPSLGSSGFSSGSLAVPSSGSAVSAAVGSDDMAEREVEQEVQAEDDSDDARDPFTPEEPVTYALHRQSAFGNLTPVGPPALLSAKDTTDEESTPEEDQELTVVYPRPSLAQITTLGASSSYSSLAITSAAHSGGSTPLSTDVLASNGVDTKGSKSIKEGMAILGQPAEIIVVRDPLDSGATVIDINKLQQDLLESNASHPVKQLVRFLTRLIRMTSL